jgi:hypothetical protein
MKASCCIASSPISAEFNDIVEGVATADLSAENLEYRRVRNARRASGEQARIREEAEARRQIKENNK